MIPTVGRSGRLIFCVSLASLALLWSCRLPRLCIFDQFSGGQVIIGGPDLSAPDAPFISWPLARVCTETTRWTPGLVFLCDNNSGGIGNIRNFILTCLRYAIEAGATGITMPTIQTRSPSRLDDLFIGKKLPFSYFFDEEHFRQSLHAACPQITIYDAPEDIPGLDMGNEGEEEGRRGDVRPDMITPNRLGQRGGCDQRDLNRHADLFGPRLHAWLGEKQERLSQDPISPSNPKLIRFNWGVQWTFPVYRDGPEFVATFGGLLRFRADILELGYKTVAAMNSLAALSASHPTTPEQTEEEEEEKKEAANNASSSFIGIHLRTESDALSSWPSFHDQTSAYLARASTLRSPPPRFAYLATGNATEAARLASLALEEHGLRVLTKHELLAGQKEGEEEESRDLLERLGALSWDQQALVDFVVLLQAEYFLGVSPSSFSLNVALKRHLKHDGLYTRPWRVGVEGGDGRSWLVGRFDGYWDDWLFMYDSLWP
ncbi:hypothetical protein M406DRAFT_259106 [Cryphonectria parasitica EP155]|uniref:Alternative oxidase n=1 Tax=Cryphonectria parasitica (strain ATCC 38755 / EP155) TaxID=660469 RepID=A0A9P4Y1E7_CRYP1|nr:uncharacterized protein M406DRAFT_259106 [Cryphonectria parasitica EP155]KAF3765202.1 hypothetical protein M406DRAFT_259106 [Cryphonectria parasitica EP155]